MKKLLTLLLFFPLFALAQTCDVDLIGFNPETNQISVAILNGENCGCNEYTQQQDGNTCDDSPSSVINNNESITHFVFGLHIYQDFTEGPCSQANFHPGWAFAYPPNQTILTPETGHQTGDTVNFELVTFNDWDCLLEQDFDEECLELVVWQINLSQTADPESFPNEFWTDTCGTCANQTQIYPDIDLSNNTLVWCPDQVPPSPLYPGCTDEGLSSQVFPSCCVYSLHPQFSPLRIATEIWLVSGLKPIKSTSHVCARANSGKKNNKVKSFFIGAKN